MTPDEFLEHNAKSRIMADNPDFYTYNPDTASPELTERFNALVTEKIHALNEAYLEECLSQEVPDGTVIDVDDKVPSLPCSWVNMMYHVTNWPELGKALDFKPDTFDCIGFIKSIWFRSGYDTWDVIRTALEEVGPKEIVRINWSPIPNCDRPDEKPSVLNQVPHTCGIADGENYFHGLSPLNLPSIAQFGLHPSDEGAGSANPMLYTCKTRRTPIDIYSENARLPFNVPGSSESVWKTFRCLLGIVSTNQYPYHTKKVSRPGGLDKNQYLHARGTYEPRWVEFIPMYDEEIVISRNEEVVNTAAPEASKRSAKALIKKAASNALRHRKAQALITRFADLPTRTLSDGPEQFVRLLPRDPPRQTPRNRNRRSKKSNTGNP